MRAERGISCKSRNRPRRIFVIIISSIFLPFVREIVRREAWVQRRSCYRGSHGLRIIAANLSSNLMEHVHEVTCI